MRAGTAVFLATATTLVSGTAALADVAPDPVVSTGIVAIVIGVIALSAVAAVMAIRYLRRRAAGK